MLIIEESERTEKGYWKLCIYDTVFLYIKHCSKKQSALILFKSSWMSISYSSKFRAISMCTVQACECTQTHTHTHTQHQHWGVTTLGELPLWRVITVSSAQLSRSVVSDSLQPHGPQHARPPCPSPTPGIYLPKLMSIESVMPSNHLILCCPLLLLPSIFPSIRVFSNESAFHIR